MTDAADIAEIAQESKRFDQTITPNDYEIFANILESGQRIEVASHEIYLDEPRRRRGTTTVTDVGSFAELLKRDEHEGSVIFADETRSTLTAVINYTTWRDHRVVLQLERSEQYRRWFDNNDTLMRQTEFALLIEDSLADIYEPPAADMLELAQSFEATKEVQFESGRRINNGAIKFRYIESIDAKAGAAGDIEVPASFVVGIPLWRGGERVALRANLRYSIGPHGLRLGYKLIDLEDIGRKAFLDIVQDLWNLLAPSGDDNQDAASDDPTSHTIVSGPAPAAITPLP